MLCLSTVKEFALVIAISIPNFFYLFVNKKSILRLCTSYQIHFHFTGSLIKEFQSTGSPSTKSFLYSKHSHIFNESIPDISRVACGQLAFANSRSSSVSSSKIWKSEINISLRFIFRTHSQLFIVLVPFIVEFGQMLQGSKFFANQVLFYIYVISF